MFPPGEMIVPIVTVVAGVSAWGVCHPSAQIFGRTLRRIRLPMTIALTFDDGPNRSITPRLLDLLDRYDARATFFVIGERVRRYQSITSDIVARGHSIGNHTDGHPNLVWLTTGKIVDELLRCQDSVFMATRSVPSLMRPPFGYRGPHLPRAVARAGIGRVAMWSVSVRDWVPQSTERLVRSLSGVSSGDVVLMHDGDHRRLDGDRANIVEALEWWLPRWVEKGMRCVSLNDIQSDTSLEPKLPSVKSRCSADPPE